MVFFSRVNKKTLYRKTWGAPFLELNTSKCCCCLKKWKPQPTHPHAYWQALNEKLSPVIVITDNFIQNTVLCFLVPRPPWYQRYSIQRLLWFLFPHWSRYGSTEVGMLLPAFSSALRVRWARCHFSQQLGHLRALCSTDTTAVCVGATTRTRRLLPFSYC